MFTSKNPNATVTLLKHYDDFMSIPAETITGTLAEVNAKILDDLNWANDLIDGGEVPGTVTLNTDSATNPTNVFLVWHMTDGSPIQTDTFTLLRG